MKIVGSQTKRLRIMLSHYPGKKKDSPRCEICLGLIVFEEPVKFDWGFFLHKRCYDECCD